MTEEKKSGSELMSELDSLGKQLVTTVKALWDNDESRKLRQEIGDGFVQLGEQVDSAIKTAQESETAQELKVQFQDTVDKARESDVAADVQENLVSGLHQLNTELGKLVTSFAPSDGSADEPAAGAQDDTGGQTDA